MLASYFLSMFIAIPVIVLRPESPVAYLILGHVALSIALFRYSRAIFLGVDYLIDPHQPAKDDDDGFDDGLKRLLDTPPSGGALKTRHDKRHVVGWLAELQQVGLDREMAEDAAAVHNREGCPHAQIPTTQGSTRGQEGHCGRRGLVADRGVFHPA